MYARFFTSTLKISLTVVYTPTNESTEEAKETFMEQLQETIKRDTNHDILFIIGDYWSGDHELVQSKIRIKPKKQNRNKDTRRKKCTSQNSNRQRKEKLLH